MLDAAVDHVAIAVRDMRAAIPIYVDALGARFAYAGDQVDQGFRWAQFRFPHGGKIELVTPLSHDGFVARFLERRGEGVHHVTLKVPDIHRSLEHLAATGLEVFGVSIDNADWKEAFIHPSRANGTLIQIAQAAFSDEEMARHHLDGHADESHSHPTLDELLSAEPLLPPEPAPS